METDEIVQAEDTDRNPVHKGNLFRRFKDWFLDAMMLEDEE